MKIAVLNGSPKGNDGVTAQYVHYLRKRHPGVAWTLHPVAQRIGALEKDGAAFQAVLDDVAASDAVLWAFPLYYGLVSAQMKRFIEMVFAEAGAAAPFRGKHAAALSTSIHFFDHTAHNYIHAVSDDLAMRYLGFYSAEMYDLARPQERARFTRFAENLLEMVRRNDPGDSMFSPLPVGAGGAYIPASATTKVDLAGKSLRILTDIRGDGGNLAAMVQTLRDQFSTPVEVISLYDVDIAGGCKGCIACGYDNTCIYRDGFRDFFETKVKTADILVLAGTMVDRYWSSRWKLFFDRSFYNTHRPVLAGKQIAFLVAGPLMQNANLREVLTSYVEVSGANPAGFVSDEDDAEVLTARLTHLAVRLARQAGQGYVAPATFLGVGGIKLFRDKVWGSLRFVFLGDHRYYKQHGIYDFPQRRWRTRLKNLIMVPLMRMPFTRRKIRKVFMERTVAPLRAVVDRADGETP